MRTTVPAHLPMFRSEMQIELLALLLLQPERWWTLQELSKHLGAPHSSVHRELGRLEDAGIIRRDAGARPHRFSSLADGPLTEPLTLLLQRTVGVEKKLSELLDRDDVDIAVVHGSWVAGPRRPDSDIDVMVVGNADLRELRRVVRPVGQAAGRKIDLTLFSRDELRALLARKASFASRLLDGPTRPLVGDLSKLLRP